MPAPAIIRQQDKTAAIRVMVVDDSAVVRGLIVRILEADPCITVVATCSNGMVAVQQAARVKPDVIVLDVEMPVMDGLTAVPNLLQIDPSVRIIMASTLTQRNAQVSMDALARGAADYLPKPTTSGIGASHDFRRDLIQKVVELGHRSARPLATATPSVQPAKIPLHHETAIHLRAARPSNPKVLVIGSSTGGPQALMTLLAKLPPVVDVPILIAQHMPPTFTTILAQHITRASGRPCHEAVHNEELRSGLVYLAPGDFHLEIAREGGAHVAKLSQEPPEYFCRPSVNPLFRSAARLFGAKACAVMLTGMGSDGLEGARELAEAGAPIIAQNEATCVVWGMPGAIATAGLCTAVLPLNDMPAHLAATFAGGRR